jgi:diguanylate cyclase (GGDEF)-like protein/PAS domain S-box-containing protein
MSKTTSNTYLSGQGAVADAQPRAGLDVGVLSERFTALEDQVSGLYEWLPFGSHSVSEDGTYESINARELAWLGCTRDDVVGRKKLTDFLDPESRDRYEKQLDLHGKFGFSDLELDLQGAQGRKLHVSLSFSGFCSANGKSRRNRFSLFDLSAVQSLRDQQRIAAIAFESLSGICVTDTEGKIIQVNSAFTTLTGYSAAEAQGESMRMVSSGRHDETFYKAMWGAINASGSWQGEIVNRRKDGQVFTAWTNISAVHGEAGQVTNYVGIFYDITANKATQAEISRMAYFDALTQLPNRRLLQERLNHALTLATRSGSYGAILFVDLDHFKMINDTRGHHSGDLLLIEVARRLRMALRSGDTIARLGGDEFVVLLEVMDADALKAADHARQVADKLLLTLAEPYKLLDFEFRCTASIGISLFSHAETVGELLQHADLAMYQAKKTGRNTLRFFDPDMQQSVNTRVSLEQDIHRALEQRQFILHFQPQVGRDRRIIGAEALLRWLHPVKGLVSPAEFIPVAEDTGHIVPMGRWVLETACAQLKTWEQNPRTRDLQLAVNVSARQFHEQDFVAMVETVLRQSQVRPELLKLEVTESAVLDVEDAIAKMQALKQRGVKFSMDDFGTGFSSLSSLSRLPLSQLKIDRSFVRNMNLSQGDSVIVQTIIAMARTFGMEVMAEGVETEAQLALLQAHGCTQYQGYLFGRPEPVEKFESLFEQAALPLMRLQG